MLISKTLDTGCTPLILNYNHLAKWGLLDQMIPIDVYMGQHSAIRVADGRINRAKGIILNVKIRLWKDTIVSDALCIDATGDPYEVLLGRIPMARLGVGVDLQTSCWYIREGYDFERLKVSYNGDVNCLFTDVVTNKITDTYGVPEDDILYGLVHQVFKNAYLTDKQRDEAILLTISKKKAFGIDYSDLEETNIVKLHVDTGSARPITKRPFQHMSHSELELLKKDLEKMVESGVLTPALDSSWAIHVMYIPKKTGDKRLVRKFQDLNKVTVRDPWPLPVITHLLEAFNGAKYFSAGDLLKGFHSIGCADEETIKKLTITTPYGNYSYKKTPFGIVNGPSVFSRAIHLALQEFIPHTCVVYIDDYVVFNDTFEDHIKSCCPTETTSFFWGGGASYSLQGSDAA